MGISVWAYSPLAQGLLTGKFRSVEDVPLSRRETRFYSGDWKQGRHHDPGFEKEIFAFLHLLIEKAEQSGYTPAEVAMNFLKAPFLCQSILVGSRSPQQLAQNISAYEADIPGSWMDEIEAASDSLKPLWAATPTCGSETAAGSSKCPAHSRVEQSHGPSCRLLIAKAGPLESSDGPFLSNRSNEEVLMSNFN